jgi:hypothetical protein
MRIVKKRIEVMQGCYYTRGFCSSHEADRERLTYIAGSFTKINEPNLSFQGTTITQPILIYLLMVVIQ